MTQIAGTFNAAITNAYTDVTDNGIAGNSVTLLNGDAVTKTGGFIVKTAPGDTIEGVSISNQVYTSTNQTIEEAKVIYKPETTVGATYILPVNIIQLIKVGALVTGNLIDLQVNGVSMTQVPFNTSNNQTMDDLATQLNADFGSVISASTVSVHPDTINIIPVTGAVNSDIVITQVMVTGGATQPVFTPSGNTVSTYGQQFVLPQTDEGQFFDLTVSQQVDYATKDAVSGQVKLNHAADNEFSIANT